MLVSLTNEDELNAFLHDIVFPYETISLVSEDDLKRIDFVEKNQDFVVRSMVYEWVLNRAKRHMFISFPQAFELMRVESKRGVQKVYTFHKNQVPESFSNQLFYVCDFLYSKAEDRVHSLLSLARETNIVSVRLNYLNTVNAFKNFKEALQMADFWHLSLKEGASLLHKSHLYKQALPGTRFVCDLGQGFQIVELVSPDALDYESACMGHCVGQGGYDVGVQKRKFQIFSLRDKLNYAHVTLEVKNGAVMQVKGKQNKRPSLKYLPFIQRFVLAQNFDVRYDKAALGFYEKEGVFQNVFALKPGDVVEESLDICDFELRELPDFSGVRVKGNFDCRGNPFQTIDVSHLPVVEGQIFMPREWVLNALDQKYYNLFQLPQSQAILVKGDLDLEFMGLKELPDLSSVTVLGDFKCRYNQFQKLSASRFPTVCGKLVVENKFGLFIDDLTKQVQSVFDLPKGERFVVSGNLDLSNIGLTALPDLSGVEVLGNFVCKNNRLKNLVGSPKLVEGSFDCSYNHLFSLEGVPQKIGGSFSCISNHLKNLEQGPEFVGGSYACFYNPLTGFEGAPKYLRGDFVYAEEESCFNNAKLSATSKAPYWMLSYKDRILPLNELLVEQMVQNGEIKKNVDAIKGSKLKHDFVAIESTHRMQKFFLQRALQGVHYPRQNY